MGTGYSAICNNCGKHFSENSGCSMVSELLRCGLCSKEKWIFFNDFGSYPSESPVYEQRIEKMAGVCSCGGKFKVNAPARCPRNKSPDWGEDPEGPVICYGSL